MTNAHRYSGGERRSRRAVLRGAGLGVAGLAGAALIGCGSGDDEAPAGSATTAPAASPAAGAATQAASGGPRPGGTLTIRGYDPAGWDSQKFLSYTTQIQSSYLYSKLTAFPFPGEGPSDFTPSPDLAESWETPDELTYIFHLRPNAKWHNKPPVNGRDFVAEDVKYTLDRFLEIPENAQKYYFEDLASIETPDSHTVTLKTVAPSAIILDNTANPFVWMLAHEVAEKHGDFNTSEDVVGTGPWMLGEYTPDVGSTLVRNPDYFVEGRPYIDEVKYLSIADASTRFAQFAAGKLDVNAVSWEELDEFKKQSPQARIEEYGSIAGFYLYMNVDNNAQLADERVRQAMSLGLDRQTFIAGFNNGKAAVGTAVPAPLAFWHLPPEESGDGAKFFQFDQAEAKKLLDAAGFKDGLSTQMIGYAYSPAWVEMAEWSVDQLSKIGIKVELQPLEYANYISTAYGGGDQLKAMGWEPSTSYTTIDDYLYGVYHSTGGKNQSRVRDPELDALVEKQRTLLDRNARREAVFDVQRYLAVKHYMIHMSYPVSLQAYQPWLKDVSAKNGYDQGGRYINAWIEST